MNDEWNDSGLSEAGTARKREMFDALASEMERVRVGRVRRRRGVVGAVVVLGLGAGVWFMTRGGATVQQGMPQPEKIAEGTDGAEVEIAPVGPERVEFVTRIAGGPTIGVQREFERTVRVERAGGRSNVARAGDGALLAELRRMGSDAGIVRRGGSVFLTASVGKKPEKPMEEEPQSRVHSGV